MEGNLIQAVNEIEINPKNNLWAHPRERIMTLGYATKAGLRIIMSRLFLYLYFRMRNYLRAKFYLAVFVQDSGKRYKLPSEEEKH